MSNPEVLTSEQKRVQTFFRRFGLAHLELACVAAVPLAITPELLYQLMAEFVPHAPYTAVADLLLSRLCNVVGFEVFEMETSVRDALLQEMREDHPERGATVARFLVRYMNTNTEDARDERLQQVQHSAAMMVLNPEAEFAALLAQLKKTDALPTEVALAEAHRMYVLTNKLGAQLSATQREELVGALPDGYWGEIGRTRPIRKLGIRYINFDVRFTEHRWLSEGEESVRAEVRVGDEGKGGGFTVRAFGEQRRLCQELYRDRLNADEIRRLGELLAEVLLGLGVRRLFTDAYRQLKPNERIRIRIFAPPVLASLPWEYAFLKEEATMAEGEQREQGEPRERIEGYIALNPRVSMVRVNPNQEVLRIPTLPDIGVQFTALLSSPTMPEFTVMDLDQEAKTLRESLSYATAFQLETISQASLDQFQAALRAAQETATVLHVGSQGYFEVDATEESRVRGQGTLVFTSADGAAQRIDASRLAEMMPTQHNMALAVFTASRSARRDDVNDISSPASVLSQSVPAVIGMQGALSSTGGSVFNHAFYRALGAGQNVEAALSAARIALSQSDELDWGLPVLYLNTLQRVAFVSRKITPESQAHPTTRTPRQALPENLRNPTPNYLATLVEGIVARFNDDELDAFYLDLGLDSSRVRGIDQQVKAQQLVDYFVTRREDLPSLVYALGQLRLGVDWVNAPQLKSEISNERLAQFRQLMRSRFNLEDIRFLCADLNVEYESLKGVTLVEKIQQVLLYFVRRERINDLVDACLKTRPNINWLELLSEKTNETIENSSIKSESLETNSTSVKFSQTSLARLRQEIVQAFDLSELNMFCFEMHIPLEELYGETLTSKAQSLIEYCSNRSRLSELIEQLKRIRPVIGWDNTQTPTQSKSEPAIKSLLPEKRSLRNYLIERFDSYDLAYLCSNLSNAISADISLEDVGGDTKPSQVLNLINYCSRRGWYDYLVDEVRKMRPENPI